MVKQINKKSVVFESSTSFIIFALPSMVFIASIFYLFQNTTANIFPIILVNIAISIPSILGYYQKKIILTRNSIYVYVRNKKIFSLSLVNDLYLVDIENDKYGSFFGYGTLTIVNKNKQMYQYLFLDNAEEFKDQIMKRYERNMKKNDPNFIPTYKIDEKNNNNKLDTLEEINEK